MKYIATILSCLVFLSCSTFEERKQQYKEMADNISYENKELEDRSIEHNTIEEEASNLPENVEDITEETTEAEETEEFIEPKTDSSEIYETDKAEKFEQADNSFHYVIISSFAKETDAQKLVAELKSKNFINAGVIPNEQGGYRVSILYELSKDAAKIAMEQLPDIYKEAKPWIVSKTKKTNDPY